MKRATHLLRFAFIMMLAAMSLTSCVKKEYDDLSTANVDPDLPITHTIQQLQALVPNDGDMLKIDSNYTIAGVVVGDDRSGNIYKKIIIEDNSFGMAIQVDITNFYTEYPIGRRVFVKCKGLYLGNNGGNFEIGVNGGGSVGRIPSNMVSLYLVKGKWGQTVAPIIATPAAAAAGLVPTNTLVKLENVEFGSGFEGVAWATSNSVVEDCLGNQVDVYTSSYCNFAYELTPTGKGSIMGVYTIYNGAGELQVRDTYDADMTGNRCGSNPNATLMPLDSVRMLDPGAGNTLTLPQDRFIRVVVTSDLSTSMITSKNIYCQDGTDAIQVRFTAANTFPRGSVIDINISGMELSTFSGVLQINNVPNSNAVLSSGLSISPRAATIADINANFNAWEGQLVTISGVTITGSGTYSGTNTLTDATGTIALFTTSSATFASTAYPTGTVTVTGILTEYNGTLEILIRDPSIDVQ
ncbi:MAG: DUF5689 domain-containing protein [Bacteroidia bacterium]